MNAEKKPAAATQRGNKRFFLIVFSIAIAMAVTAVYMGYLVKTVPKTVSNSKAGIFVEMTQQLISYYDAERLAREPDLAAINVEINRHFAEAPWQLKNGESWTLDSWSLEKLHGRFLLLAKYRSVVDGEPILLAAMPISKRNFPKTGGFSHKDAWFFTFGQDHNKAVLPDHQAEVSLLEQRGLNLVATNYGNDIFIIMLSARDSKELGRELFEMTTIHPPADPLLLSR